MGCQDLLERNRGSGHLFRCQAGKRRALLWMSEYPGHKLVLRTPSAVRLAKGQPFLGCHDILDRNWGSGHLFSCQAGERTGFLDVRISWTETGSQDTSTAVRLAKGQAFFGCQDILDINWGSGHSSAVRLAKGGPFFGCQDILEQKLGLRTPLQLSGWQKECLSSDVRLSGAQVNAHNASSAVRKFWARAYPQDGLFQLPVVRRIKYVKLL